MTKREAIRIAAILLVVGLTGYLSGNGRPGTAQESSTVPSTNARSQQRKNGIPPRDVLLKRAWQLMASFTSGEYAVSPRWEASDWQTKCMIGLDVCSADKHGLLFTLDAENGPFLKTTDDQRTREFVEKLSQSLRLPVQDESDHGKAKAQRMRFASVLFDPDATRAISNDVDRWKNKGDHSAFAHSGNLVLAKAIWTFVPLDASGKSSHLPYETLLVTNVQGSPDEGWRQRDPETLKADTFFSPILDIHVPYNEVVGCSPRRHSSLSPKCFRAIPLKVLSPREVGSAERETSAVLSDTCGDHGCVAILMGIHFMVHLDKNDPLFRHSPWLFMTFWWTGEDNGQSLPAPWKYFAANAVQDERDDSPDVLEGARRIAFNPYLEGINTNGAVANCVTCHSYAAVNGGIPPTSLIGPGTSVCLGSPPIPKTNCDLSGQPCKAQELYKQPGVVSADRIWSLAHLNDAQH